MAIDIELKEGEYTKYEKARIVGSRALQISLGAPLLVDLDKKKLEEIEYNPVEIAKIEFKEGKLPIDVKRILPHHKDSQMY